MAMSVGDSRLIISPSQAATAQAPTRVFRVSQVRRLRKCQQVAAVCYRIRGSNIEFLLVQTRGGRWTFPKGGVEPALTHAQAAALEAYEEAGVQRLRLGGGTATDVMPKVQCIDGTWRMTNHDRARNRHWKISQ